MTKILPNKLLVSERFFSIQGEGKTSGVPAYFIRLSQCNIQCGSSIRYLNSIKKGEINPDLNEPYVGDLEIEGKATWSCFLDNHKIKTITGSKSLSELKIGDELLGFNEVSNEIEKTNITRLEFVETDNENLLTITLENKKRLTCTKDHLFYVKNEWKRADQLLLNDELWHVPFNIVQGLNSKFRWETYSDEKQAKITKAFGGADKSYMFTDEYKQAHSEGQKKIDWEKVSIRMRENNPMKNVDVVKKSWSNRHIHKISGPEQKILNLEKQYNWGIKYCGNGTFWIENQNPDFIIPGTNKLIETYDSSYPQYDRDEIWEDKRRIVYERNGYEVLFIDFYDKMKKKSNYTVERKAEFVKRIQEFIMNGLKVIKLEKYNGLHRRIAKIECLPHKNYFVESVLSHNCDTTPVWLRGEHVEFQQIIDDWKVEGIYNDICSGLIHIIWTGGEPTIKQHQESIVNFNIFMNTIEGLGVTDGYSGEMIPIKWPSFQEIETNGTVYINDLLFECLDQINCSPKLSNSGMTEKQRIVPEAIERIKSHHNYQFKFVISNEDDIFEMFETYIKPFNIPLKNVVCMPALTSRENFHERTKWCMEMAKKYRFIGLTRLHVSAYDALTGV